ncbi:MAG: transposase [Vicinamibacteria bacterium]
MMAAAADESDARTGMVAVIQTFGSSLKWNPHIHTLATRGLFLPDGQWEPIPYVDSHRAELVFRHKLLGLLRNRDLITQERIDLLLSWRNSGLEFTIEPPSTLATPRAHKVACHFEAGPGEPLPASLPPGLPPPFSRAQG